MERARHLPSDSLDAPAATVVATYADGPLAGRPAITRRELAGRPPADRAEAADGAEGAEGAGDTGGPGVAWYLSTLPDDATLRDLLAEVLAGAGVPTEPLPDGVERVRRVGAAGSWLFVLNHSTEPVRVAATGRDLVAGRDVTGSLELAAGAVAVVAER